MENFLHIIQPLKVFANRVYKLILRGRISGNNSVKLMYEMLNRPAILPSLFPDHSIWNPMVPLKVGIFAWEASWGKVLTLDQLKRRERPLANKCYLCERGGDHRAPSGALPAS